MSTKWFCDEETRWQALKQRDVAADDYFVFATTTTGCFALPSSATVLPPRETVVFFDSADAAEAAGYRLHTECLTSLDPYPAKWLKIVEKACVELETTTESVNLATLAAHCEISQSYLHRIFTTVTGLTPKAYSAGIRAKRLRDALDNPEQSVTAAIYQAGYTTSSRFYENATDRLGMSAKRYRQGAKGITIYFALGQCSLGTVLVAQSEKGVCAISLGDDPQPLIERLQQQFAQAELRGGDPHYEQLVAQVIGYLEQPRSTWHLPLDIQGTVFQERVWRALRDIPPGSTASYTEIAERIGSPKAVRAVAQACAANRIAVVIPCHRVIRQDGSLSGYRWGIERKTALLDREQSAPTHSAEKKSPSLDIRADHD
ncbi:bifunctional DNA-binding transcriptional regulator/O6-methylguanine-DNA methyltransferase Ada [Tatumella sp. TA1]|nr:bifunctional DNA-binding transcriptional regulator/O6-methylguanine-DNA methyltransferase Ada [Tatumella sp. TA1]